MIARTHDLAAITALVIVVVLVSPLQGLHLSTILVALLANQLGGIAPDIDQPTAPFWRTVSFGKIFGPFATKLLGGHRFITHSLLGLFAIGFLLNWLLIYLQPVMPHVQTEYVWWAFMIGMVSHLIMDSFSKEGVPWLLPIPVKFGFPPLKAFRVTTGKGVEKFIILPALATLLTLICINYYPVLVDLFQQEVVG